MTVSFNQVFVCFWMALLCSNQAFSFSIGEERLNEPQYIKQLTGKRVAVLAHHASRDHSGNHVVDRLASMASINLKMIFAPEHGYRSLNDELVPDSIDSVTGLPVYSLYGPRKAPTPDMLSQLDVLLIDLQDIGLRYYTYPATVIYALKACKAAGVKVMLLDRPNPLGGDVVEGALLDSSMANGGLTTLAAIPTRHGMTLGELSLYLNSKLKIGADLTVIPMSDYTRTMSWKETGLPWVPPSPALVAPEQALYYAFFGTLESGNLAVGRGLSNELAFKVVGAPWITPAQQNLLVSQLNTINIPGFSVQTFDWTATRAIFTGNVCHGIQFNIQDDISVKTFPTLLNVLQVFQKTLGQTAEIEKMLSMLGAPWVLDGIMNASPINDLVKRSDIESSQFKSESEIFRLY